MANQRLSESGKLEIWPKPENCIREFKRIKIAAVNDPANFGAFARNIIPGLEEYDAMFPSARLSRKLAALKLLHANASNQEVKRAFQLHPVNPLIHISLARLEANEKRARFLREHGVKRLTETELPEFDSGEILHLVDQAIHMISDKHGGHLVERLERKRKSLEK